MARNTGSRGTPSRPRSTPRSVSAPSSTDESMSIRKISNGYVISKSSTNSRGQFKHTETFTSKKPKIEV